MTIDFGRVQRYIGDRGFGFVSHTFADMTEKEVFFHIKTINRTHPKLVTALDSTASSTVYFWYEYRVTPKGQEVTALLDIKQLRKHHPEETAAFLDIINTNWMNTDKPLCKSITKATIDLLSPDEVNQLSEHRSALEAECKKRKEEQQKIELDRLLAIAEQQAAKEKSEFAMRQAIRDQEEYQKTIEDEEFSQLVAEISELKYTNSSQVSAYIVYNKLGFKYKNISGVLEMELEGRRWKFNGGFPTKIYRRLCEALKLTNNGSQATPVTFTPYKNIINS